MDKLSIKPSRASIHSWFVVALVSDGNVDRQGYG